MGINKLSSFIKDCKVETKIYKSGIKVLGIDTSLYMHKFCHIHTEPNCENVVNYFLNQNKKFLKWNIKPYYIFDNSSHSLKKDTIEKRKENNKIVVCKEFYISLIEAFKNNKIDYEISPVNIEAEQYASFLMKENKINALLTDDLDSLTFGCEYVITKLNSNGDCLEIRLTDVLKNLDINQEKFVCMCIMCGTDFNKNGMKKYGPVKSHKYVKENEISTILTFLTENVINFEEIYTLFKTYN